ncbi:hypothetical protein HanIR_Chr13g0646921 [Helianthus annuus]|nr:hypothetical protein HanIR_Chr13g0646921 [Helianthus annuus]
MTAELSPSCAVLVTVANGVQQGGRTVRHNPPAKHMVSLRAEWRYYNRSAIPIGLPLNRDLLYLNRLTFQTIVPILHRCSGVLSIRYSIEFRYVL